MAAQTFYARLERSGGRLCLEELHIHLACVGALAAHMARRLYVDVELAGGVNLSDAAAAAGALHDAGKVLFNVERRMLAERILSGDDGTLTFPGHELLSAALAGKALWERGEEPEVVAAVVRPILLHHQGLRGVSSEWVEREFRRIGSMLGRRETLEEVARGLRVVLARVSRLLSGIKDGGSRWAADVLSYAASLYSNPAALAEAFDDARGLLRDWLSPRGAARSPLFREAIRVSTGLVMAADNVVAASASLGCGSSSVYVREAARLAEASGAPGEPVAGCRLRLADILKG